MKKYALLPIVSLITLITYSSQMHVHQFPLYFGYIPTGCTLPPVAYAPYVQPHDPELDLWRKRLHVEEDTRAVFDSNPNITVIETFKEDESRLFRCFQYAMREITGLKEHIGLPQENRISIDLNKYFVQVPQPKKNNLLIYTTSESNRTVHHFAVASDELWCRSKSGARVDVTKHLHFHLTSTYGKAMWVFDLRPEYKNDKNLLLQEIRSDLQTAAQKREARVKKECDELFSI